MSTKTLEQGAIARLTKDSNGLRKGQEVLIDDYISADEAEDGVPFCWVSDTGTGLSVSGGYVDAAALEVIMTADEASNREVPTPQEVAKSIDWLGSPGEYVSFDEADWSGDSGTVELVGTAENGLRVRAVVRVLLVVQADF